MKLRKITKNIIKLCVFASIASLPFITVTNIVGLDAFLDSFENPEYYLCLQDEDNSLKSDTNGQYVIIQKKSHPNFGIQNDDYVIYYRENGEITCNKACGVTGVQTTEKFYTYNENDHSYSGPVYPNQVIGKIVKVVDSNIWNSISIKIWDVSIHNLNIKALLAND